MKDSKDSVEEKDSKDSVEEKDSKDSANYIVSVRCEDIDCVVPGSVKRKCVKCGKDVWISPACQSLNVKNVICSKCIKSKDMKDVLGDSTTYVVTQETLNEFENWRRRRTFSAM